MGTALSSYGGFWLSLAIVLTPGGFEIVDAYAVTDAAGDPTGNGVNAFNNAFGYFGLFAAFLAWYNALAGIADDSNSFFVIPVAHFPWFDKGRERKAKTERETV